MMNVISLTSFDGYDPSGALASEPDVAEKSDEFGEIFESISNMLPSQFPTPANLPPPQTAPKGWNPDIESLKALVAGDDGAADLWSGQLPSGGQVIGPMANRGGNGKGLGPLADGGFILPTGRERTPIEIAGGGKKILPPEFPNGKPLDRMPPLWQPPTSVPPVTEIPGDGPTRVKIDTTDTPPIIVHPDRLPPSKDTNQTPPIFVSDGVPLKSFTRIEGKNDPKIPSVVDPNATMKTPRLVSPLPVAGNLRPPTPLSDRQMGPDVVDPVVRIDRSVDPFLGVGESVEIVLEPSSVRLNDNPVAVADTEIDSVFDMNGLRVTPRYDTGKLEGFSLKPSDVNSVVAAFDAIAKNAVEQPATKADANFKQAVAPTFGEIADSIRASVVEQPTPTTANAPRLTKFWTQTDPSDVEVIKAPLPAETAVNNAETVVKPIETAPATPELKPAAKPVPMGVREPARTENPDAPTIERVASNVKSREFAAKEPTLESKVQLTSEKVAESMNETREANDFAVRLDKLTTDSTKNVGETARVEKPAEAKIADQVNPHLLDLAAMASRKQEKQSLKLRLHPAELGSVEIRIERADSGALSAFFKTETDGARVALTQNIDQLRESLQNAGWQVGRMEISTGSGSNGGGQQAEPQARRDSTFNPTILQPTSDTPDDSQKTSPNRLLNLVA